MTYDIFFALWNEKGRREIMYLSEQKSRKLVYPDGKR